MTRRPEHALHAAADDRALLARFAADRDDAAFAALVRRHGPMVLGVCRRTARDPHAADDAFQATFVVLARRPDVVRPDASVAGWLFGVARRVSLAARRRNSRPWAAGSGQRERPDLDSLPDQCPPATDHGFDDLLRVLDEELARLPDDLRAPLVACYLDGRTQDEAARHLGWSLSTLRRRLAHGKALLRGRLTRRGATLGAGLVIGAVAVPPRLVAATVAAAGGGATGRVAALATAGAARGGAWVAVAAAVLVAGGVTAVLLPGEPPPAHARPMSPAPSGWATVRGQVVYPRGKPLPERRLVDTVWKDADHCQSGGPLAVEDLLVDGETRGIANVVVALRPDSDDPKAAFPPDRVHPDVRASAGAVREVEMPCCQFRPRVVAARVGDRVRFVNRSPVPHNVNYAVVGSEVDHFNVIVPAGAALDAPLGSAGRPGVAVFSCAVHPWMRGYVRVYDHPYFAVTDAAGRWAMPRVPAGRWRVAFWHERGFHGGPAGRVGTPVDVSDGVVLPPVEYEFPPE